MIRRRPRAVEAIGEQAEYIAGDSEAAAERYVEAVEKTFRDLERMPGMGHRYETENPKLHDIRVWAVSGYRNYLVFYRQVEDGVEILTVIHGARDIEAALGREV